MQVGNQESLPNCCGVADVGYHSCEQRYKQLLYKSGTGLFTATFIDNQDNRAVYEQMCEEYTLLYQSPVRRNNNSGNDLFLCVFDYGDD